MDRVTAAQVFNRICELGSLAAARALDISRPMVVAILMKWRSGRAPAAPFFTAADHYPGG